jgi:integrase
MASVTKRRWTYKGQTREAWQVRYLDQTGSYRGKQFDTKKAADAYRRRVEREIEDGEHVAATQTKTIAKACEEFLRHAEQRVIEGRIGRSRLAALRTSLETKVVPFMGAKPLRDLKAIDVEDFYGSLVRSGKLTPHSARAKVQHFKMVEDHANKRGYMKTRPVAAALRDIRGLHREPIRTFTLEEAKLLIETSGIRANNAHHRASAMLGCFVNLAAFCGLRRGEIGGLSIHHVDFDDRVIEVRSNLTEHRELKGPKTRAGIRDVPMPAHIVDMLRRWKETYYIDNPDGLLFASRSGGRLQLNTLQPLWEKLLERAELAHEQRPFHFHALRHFYASMMIEAGTPLPDVAILLGHSTFDLTLQIYTHSVLKPAARHGFVERMIGRMAAPADTNATQRLLTT